jgi:hypothetical protein
MGGPGFRFTGGFESVQQQLKRTITQVIEQAKTFFVDSVIFLDDARLVKNVSDRVFVIVARQSG